jgi:hypothetical protein
MKAYRRSDELSVNPIATEGYQQIERTMKPVSAAGTQP